jgi:hypothetical protein
MIGDGLVTLAGIIWYSYVPTYIKKRVAVGLEPAAKEAALIKNNRMVAIIIIVSSAGSLVGSLIGS